MNRPVIVTGASGFIGSALVSELIRRRIAVQSVSRHPSSKPSHGTTITVSSYDQTPCPEDSTIVHLAEISDSAIANRAGNQYLKDVKEQTSSLLAKQFKRFVYISSGAVYRKGKLPPRTPASETLSENVYTKAKLAAENLVQRAGGTIIRLSNVYGPPPKPGTVIADILAQIPGEGPLKIKDVTPARDYLWIDDVVTGIAEIALGDANGVFNLGTGVETTTGDIAKIALANANETHRSIIATNQNLSGLTDSIALDSTHTTNVFGWKPTIPVEEGMKILFEAQHG